MFAQERTLFNRMNSQADENFDAKAHKRKKHDKTRQTSYKYILCTPSLCCFDPFYLQLCLRSEISLTQTDRNIDITGFQLLV